MVKYQLVTRSTGNPFNRQLFLTYFFRSTGLRLCQLPEGASERTHYAQRMGRLQRRRSIPSNTHSPCNVPFTQHADWRESEKYAALYQHGKSIQPVSGYI